MLIDTYKHKGMRKGLVRKLVEKGISNDAVLKAIEKVPRHFFFETAFLEHAYQDKAFPIGEGQTISQPFTVAFQSELLELKAGDKVLEIGTGSGYQCCVLLELGSRVYTIEYNKKLFETSKAFLPKIGYNAVFKHGDGSLGWPLYAPYDKIIVTAGAPSVPSALIEQLSIGGILVIPVGDTDHQRMIKLTKMSEKQIYKEEFDYFRFVPLLGKNGWNN
ncbi:MAG: protein-L-isoaspartate(D-aspartate) O-methyltransferase [Cyclobacteriaceae bacterium]